MSQRIKIIKDTAEHKSGEIKVVDNNVAHALIEGGVAVITKDMTSSDYIVRKPLRRAKYGHTK